MAGQMGCEAQQALQEMLRRGCLPNLRSDWALETYRSQGRVLGEAFGFGRRQAGRYLQVHVRLSFQ